jgi:hypothetical protein
MTESEDFALEVLLEFLNAAEAGIAAAKYRIKERRGLGGKQPAAVLEETFSCLKFEEGKGVKLGDYETASKKNNDPEKFQHAFNILKNSNATIANRYHGNGYNCSFWIYGDRIFKQRLKK